MSKLIIHDPDFHQPSYDAGYADGESNASADYYAALSEMPDFEWPADRGFDPMDVVAVISGLVHQIGKR